MFILIQDVNLAKSGDQKALGRVIEGLKNQNPRIQTAAAYGLMATGLGPQSLLEDGKSLGSIIEDHLKQRSLKIDELSMIAIGWGRESSFLIPAFKPF